MQIFLALFFLGIIQGLTEFLPVSSSGHLVLFSKLFGIEESLFISIILHFATLLSILLVLRKEVWEVIRKPFSQKTIALAIATLPTCLIVLVIMPFVKDAFSGAYLPICFAITGTVLLLCEMLSKKSSKNPINFKTAFLMGVAQGFAVFPGISRSGSTISAGLACKKDKEEVAKFSFLMSIPIILLSVVLEIYQVATSTTALNVQILPMIFSFLVAFVVGIFAIKFMIKLTSSSNLKWFSLYLGIIALVSVFII